MASRGGRQIFSIKRPSEKADGASKAAEPTKAAKSDKFGGSIGAPKVGGGSGISFALKKTTLLHPNVRLGNQRHNPLSQTSLPQSTAGRGLFGIASYLSESDVEEESQQTAPTAPLAVTVPAVLPPLLSTDNAGKLSKKSGVGEQLPGSVPKGRVEKNAESPELDSYLVAESMLYSTALPAPRSLLGTSLTGTPREEACKDVAKEISRLVEENSAKEKSKQMPERSRDRSKTPSRRTPPLVVAEKSLPDAQRITFTRRDRRENKFSSDVMRADSPRGISPFEGKGRHRSREDRNRVRAKGLFESTGKRLSFSSQTLRRPSGSSHEKSPERLRRNSRERFASKATAESQMTSTEQERDRVRLKSPVHSVPEKHRQRPHKDARDILVVPARPRSPLNFAATGDDLRLKLIEKHQREQEEKERRARAESHEIKERIARDLSREREIRERIARELSREREMKERMATELSRERERIARELSREWKQRRARGERSRAPATLQYTDDGLRLEVLSLDGKITMAKPHGMRKTETEPRLFVGAAHEFEGLFLQLWDTKPAETVILPPVNMEVDIPIPRSESRESSIGIVIDEATNIEPVDMEIDEPSGSPAKINAPEESRVSVDLDRHPKISFSFGGFGGKKKEDTVSKREETSAMASMWSDKQDQPESEKKPLDKMKRFGKDKSGAPVDVPAFNAFLQAVTEPVSDTVKAEELADIPGPSRELSEEKEKRAEDALPTESFSKQKTGREKSLERGRRDRQRNEHQHGSGEFQRRRSKERKRKYSVELHDRKSPISFQRRGSPNVILLNASTRSKRSARFSPVRLHAKQRSRSQSAENRRSPPRSLAAPPSRSPRRSRSRSLVVFRRSRSPARLAREISNPSKKDLFLKQHGRGDSSSLSRKSPRHSPHRRSRSPRLFTRSPPSRRRSRSPFDKTQQTLEERERRQDMSDRRLRGGSPGRPHFSGHERISLDKENEPVDYECFARGDFRQTRNASNLVNVSLNVEEVPLPSDAVSPVKDEPKNAAVNAKPADKIPVPLRTTQPSVVPEHEMPFPSVPEPVTGLFPVPFSFTSTGPLFCWPYLLPDSSIVLLPYLGLQKPEDKSKVEHFLVVPKEVNSDASDGVPLNFLAIPTYDPTRAVPPPPPAATAPLNQPCKPAIVRLLKLREMEKEKARRQATKRSMPTVGNLETPTPNSTSLSSTSVTPMVPLQQESETPETAVLNSFEAKSDDVRGVVSA